MNIEIISIGDELLDGSVKETNANYISNILKEYNLTPNRISIIGDQKDDIITFIKKAKIRSGLIFITGGLGPTNDDLTKEAVAEAFNLKLLYHQELNNKIKSRLKTYHVQYTDNNRKQAMIPESAIILDNSHGTAPGFIVKKDNTTCITLPGVPNEMKKMIKNQVLEHLNLKNGNTYKKELFFKGIGEAQLEDTIKRSIRIPSELNLSFVVKGDHILVKLSSKDEDTVNAIYNTLKDKLSQNIFEELDLPDKVYKIMNGNNLKLSVAESCTGGLLGNRITNIAGSSNIFKGGVIAYSNQLKIDLLNIDPNILYQYGAVSIKVAYLMANNIKKTTNTDYSISITGIAGPTGGTDSKPVGLVFIAVSGKTRTIISRYQLKGRRRQIKYLSTEFALKTLKSCLIKEGYHEKE